MSKRRLSIDGQSCFYPNGVLAERKADLIAGLPENVRVKARDLIAQNWRIFVVDQNRGRCYYKEQVVTVPQWAIERETDYKTWYLSHEMAHAYCAIEKTLDNHGPMFMKQLKRICPENVIHFELGYKPRNAASAGIMPNLSF